MYLEEGEEDPFKDIIYADFVNSKRNILGNSLGWLDYNDRLLSRHFSLLDHPILNVVLGFYAWLFNRF